MNLTDTNCDKVALICIALFLAAVHGMLLVYSCVYLTSDFPCNGPQSAVLELNE